MYDTSVNPWKYKQVGGDFTGQFNGNLYNPSKTAHFIVQDDYNLVLYCDKDGSAVWSRFSGNSGSC